MPIFEYGTYRYEGTGGKNKWGHDEYKKVAIVKGLIPKDEFYKNMKLKKSQKGFDCIVCGGEKVKGTRYIGNHYEAICYNCVSEWVDASNKTLLGIKEIMEGIKEAVKENKEKWDKEVLINSLE